MTNDSTVLPADASDPAAPLAALGFDARTRALFAAAAPEGARPARVASVAKGAAGLLAPEPLTAAFGPALRASAAADPVALPCPGDWVVLRTLPDGTHLVHAVLERRTAFVRSGVGADSHGQVLAANVDTVFITEPVAAAPNLGRVERLLALAWESGAEPVVVLTKADLAADRLPGLIDAASSAAPGAQVHAVSAVTGAGLDALAAHLAPARTIALLGPSGAGKSSLVNALAGTEVMAAGGVRDDGRGRHTTTHRQLVALPGGALVLDTPGLRRINLHDTDAGLDRTFADLLEIAEQCRFNDCAHDSEPGCAVRAAIEDGTLERRRLDSWRKLRREAEWQASRTDARLRQERLREWKQVHKEVRRRGYRP
ncbi:ribosome small subunit-dependent GTPase A [Allonocardiopsis opalescens]|uniref:Small ribosomal subunit biogenesis GTPase RsgA n=1 Tax=Allonocardiopsis opalescens TaxID=1144618 RepID=A0A2T0PTM7_9ACTN|nr:ribosome small subunit-dependent GTPase A [Allonocardiopsis opalescens]PRX92251.1 ribosome biogenesis GTPase [Allonocardiopsis opalescens]